MAKSSRKKTKVGGKAGTKGKVKKADEILSNKIEIVEQNEEDGGDEMVIDIEVADEGDDTSDDDSDDGGGDDDDEEMDDGSVSVSSASDNEDAKSGSKTTSATSANGIPIPFLDTFYALSAENANERAVAAHCLIRHCFPADSPVQAKDAAYALRRLLSGLCSGRAGARQGYASALSSFLKVAFATSGGGGLPSIHVIQKEVNKADQGDDDDDDAMDDEGGEDHPAEFVRKLLLVQTTPRSVLGQKAAKKGSEERDYIFGRLFGIMAVVRSGTLFGMDAPVEIIGEYARSLVKLYKHKSWMRESTAHAIMELLSGLQSTGSSKATRPGLTEIVQDVINPAIILDGADGGKTVWSDIAKSMTAEQIAVALHIQMLSGPTHELPLPLSKPLLTPELIPLMANTLRDTSSKVQEQRCHLVWNAMWMYLTEIDQSGGSKRKNGGSRASDLSQRRTLRGTLPVGSGSAEESIKVIIEEVVVNGLLGSAGGGGKSNATHDRRKLALLLVQTLCGASNPRIGLPADVIENCLLQRVVVERAFVNIIRTSSGGRSSQAEHTLKPMALQILNSIVDSVVSVSADEDEYSVGLRLAIAKSLVRAEPRFDGVTKTDTITSLLLVAAGGAAPGLVKEYSEFLENIIYTSKPYEAIGYVNSLVALGKKSLRILQGDGEVDADTDPSFVLTKNLLALLLAGAFFDLSGFSEPKGAKRKGKKKSSKSTKSSQSHPVLDAAQRMITSCNHATEDGTGLPYQLRTAMASSFFSYLADAISMVPTSGGASSKREKSHKAHEIIANIIDGCEVLEANGAILYSNFRDAASVQDDADDENDASIAPKDALQAMNKLIADVPADDNIASDTAVGCSSLLSSIYLQLLSPGKPERESADGEEEGQDHMDDDNQEEMEEVNDEAREMISDVLDITRSLLNRDDDEADDDENPLAAFAELCVNILSSSLGSGTGKGTFRGSAAKLLRDSVKNAWSLVLSYAHEKNIPFEQDVMAVLVEAVCGPGAMRDEAEAQDGDDADMNSNSDDDESDSSDDEGVFTAANVADLDLNHTSSDDDGSKQDESDDDEDDDDDEEEDVELDKDQLNDILMEDSDEDPQDILEHHAGADKALAKLIKMKQEARKSGQAALERVDIAIRMRCVVLLETALAHPSLLEDSAILMAILPILRTRRSIDKEAMSGKVGANKDARLSEKKSLADRLSSMLQKKICKVRLTGLSDLSGEELSSACAARSELASHILAEAKKSPSTIHSDCCSLSLVLAMKSLPQDDDGAVVVAETLYSQALQEWSEKKTTKLKSSLFDVFTVRSPSLARIVLVGPLINAAQNSRSAFLKAESYRLLADLYHVARTDESPLSAAAMKSLEESARSAVISLSSALQDDDMTTTKRLREPLKATSELIAFGTVRCRSDAALWNELGKVSELLESLGANSKSQGVKKQCHSLVTKISEGGYEEMSETAESSNSTKKKKKKKSKTRNS